MVDTISYGKNPRICLVAISNQITVLSTSSIKIINQSIVLADSLIIQVLID